MRLAFFGTPDVAAQLLEVLLQAKQEIVCVVTQPDRPQGRGQKVGWSPVKELALKHALPLEQPESVKNDPVFCAKLGSFKPDIAVVVAYGKILPPEILNIPQHGFINVHASLLPQYRGAAPVQWALLKGEKETGITIFKLTELLDAGPIINQQKIKIKEEDDYNSLLARLFTAGGPLLLEALAEIKKGTVKYQAQDEALVTYAPALSKESSEIDWKKSAREINDRIRALAAWPVAQTYYRGKRLKVLRAQAQALDLATGPKSPGMVLHLIKGEGFICATGQGDLLVIEVQPEAGKKMNAYEFALGHRLRSGEILPS